MFSPGIMAENLYLSCAELSSSICDIFVMYLLGHGFILFHHIWIPLKT